MAQSSASRFAPSSVPGRVLLLADKDSDTLTSIHAALVHHRCAVEVQPRLAASERSGWAAWREFDLIFLYGPHNGSMSPLAPRLAELHKGARRPVVVWWLLENLPNPRWFGRAADRIAEWRLIGDCYLERGFGRWANAALGGRLALGQRFRILGELKQFWRQRWVDVVAAPSDIRVSALARRGIPAVTAPYGYHSSFGLDLGQPRDLDVLFLGQFASRRRRRIVTRLQRELAARGARLVVAGTDRYVEGLERTRLVGRAKILLNILKEPQDGVQHRFLLAAATRTLLVSEPMADPGPFRPGVHFIAAPVARLADTLCHWLRNDLERERIIAASHGFATEELRIEHSVGRILERARSLELARAEAAGS